MGCVVRVWVCCFVCYWLFIGGLGDCRWVIYRNEIDWWILGV